MAQATDTLVRVGARDISVTNLHKPYWPDDNITKGDYLAYCLSVAPWILPHLSQRPLVLTRYPDGAYDKSFYQKDAPDYTPDWVNLHPYWSHDSNRWIRFIVCEDLETLIWVANQGALELHPWLSQVSSLEHPDFAVVDLDPADGVGFAEACQAAQMLKELLQHLGIRGYPKTTGATGLHIYLPLEKRYDYRTTSEFVRGLGVVLRTHASQHITLERMVKKRVGKVYVDYLQNAMGKTLVSVFSTRPRPGATVAFPIAWNDLDHVVPEDFTLRTVPDLLKRRGDAFAPVLADRQRLEEPLRRLKRLLDNSPGEGL